MSPAQAYLLKARYISGPRILPSLQIRGDLGHEDLGLKLLLSLNLENSDMPDRA